MVAAPGFEPGSRPNLGLAGYKPAALPLSYAAELVRVRCSAHRPRRSKRRTLLARASPCYLARTAGVEPACLPVRSRVLIRLSYVRVLEPPAGTDPAPPGREPGILPLDDDGDWLPSQESNPPYARLTAGRVHLARLMGIRDRKWWSDRESNSATAILRRSPAAHSFAPNMVDQAGNDPAASSSPTRRSPFELLARAWSWFRATLSAVSTRRFHQISLPGVVWCGCR